MGRNRNRNRKFFGKAWESQKQIAEVLAVLQYVFPGFQYFGTGCVFIEEEGGCEGYCEQSLSADDSDWRDCEIGEFLCDEGSMQIFDNENWGC